MVKKVVKPAKKIVKRVTRACSIPPDVRKQTNKIDQAKYPAAFLADKIINAAKDAGLAKKPHQPKAFTKENPGPKRLSRRDEVMQIIGIDRMTRIVDVIAEKAEAGDEHAYSLLYTHLYPKGKPDRHISRTLDEFIAINSLQDYQSNIDMIVKMAAQGELDLDDSELMMRLLVQGKEFRSTAMLTDFEDRLKILNAMAPARK